MLRLTEGQRELAADKLADAANVAVGALVFGQMFNELPLSFWKAAGGVAIWLTLLAYSLKLRGQDQNARR